jgi:hypothetical protein
VSREEARRDKLVIVGQDLLSRRPVLLCRCRRLLCLFLSSPLLFQSPALLLRGIVAAETQPSPNAIPHLTQQPGFLVGLPIGVMVLLMMLLRMLLLLLLLMLML